MSSLVGVVEDNKHALRIHLILLNLTNQVARKSLKIQINKDLDPNKPNNFWQSLFSKRSYWRNSRDNEIVKATNCIFNAIEEYKSKNGNNLPQDLEIFDMTSIYSIVRNPMGLNPINGWKVNYTDYHDYDYSFAACIDNLHLIRNYFYGHLKIYGISETDYNILIKRLRIVVEKLSDSESLEKYMQKFCQIEQTLLFTQDTILEYHELIKYSHESIIELLKQKMKDQNSVAIINNYTLKSMNGINENLNSLFDRLRNIDEEMVQSILAEYFSDKSLRFNQFFIKIEETIDLAKKEIIEDNQTLKSEIIAKIDSFKKEAIEDSRNNLSENIKPIENKLDEIIAKIDSSKKETIKKQESAKISTRKSELESNIPPIKKNKDMIENIPFDTLEETLVKHKVVVLHGTPGIGKTSNALSFFEKAKQINWICLWFNAGCKENFMIDLQACTDLLNNTKGENKTFEYRSQILIREFRQNQEQIFLLILDNLMNESKWIDSFIETLPKENVYVMATSTKKNSLEEVLHQHLQVNYFDEKQARELFEKKFKKELTTDEVNLLDEYFKYDKILPYDLNLLISELNNSYTLNLEEILNGYTSICEKIFKDLYQRINKISSVAWDILQHCSLIDPEAIPMFLILELFKIDKLEWEKLTKILENNSVVEVVKKCDECCYRIHKRTQEMVQKLVNNAKKRKEKEENLIKVILNEFLKKFNYDINFYDKIDWTNAKLLLIHVLTICKSGFISERQKGDAYEKLGFYYSNVAINYKLALDYQLESLKINEPIFKQENCYFRLYVLLNNIGCLYSQICKPKEALNTFERSKKIWEKIKTEPDLYGSIPLETLLAKTNSCYFFNNKEEAHSFSSKALNSLEKVFLDLDDPEKHLEYELEAVKKVESLYKNQIYPDLALAYNKIAVSYILLKKYNEALEFGLKSEEMFINIYGEDNNPDLGMCYKNIGYAYLNLPDIEKALDYLIKSKEILEKTCSDDDGNDERADVYKNIAICYIEKKEFQKALDHSKRALTIYLKLYGSLNNGYHSEIENIYYGIYTIYKEMGDLENAAKYNKQYLKMSKKQKF
jgi:hypothetical protein